MPPVQRQEPLHDMEKDDPALAEALRRSLVQTTREEALLADAFAASLESRDAELARALQRRLEIDGGLVPAAEVGSEAPDAAYLEDLAMRDAIAASRVNHHEESWTLVTKRRGGPSARRPPPTTGPLHWGAAGHSRRDEPASALRAPPPAARAASQGPVQVVLDGLNVGCTMGGAGGRYFCARGVELALNFYRAHNLRAVALLPRNKVDSSISTRALADDVDLLLRLADEQRVFFTPPEVSDDNFLLKFAYDRQADLVSNDQFRDELYRQRGRENHKGLKTFLRAHRIPFLFVGDEFVPNPDPRGLVKGSVHHAR